MKQQELQDPLKPLHQIYEADERQAHFLTSLEGIHEELSGIFLNDSCPMDVQQLFETAKNLSLYSWFVYRFHQVSELIGFSALEMALRIRFERENSNCKKKMMLGALMKHAKKEKWITNEGFPSLYNRAKYLARHNKAMVKMRTHDFDKEPSMPIEEPDEDEISEAIENLDLVAAITSNAHMIRNDLAHGSSTLHPNSISTLRTTAEVINQIYS